MRIPASLLSLVHGFFSFRTIVRVEERLWFLTPRVAGAWGTGKTRGAGELVIAARGLDWNPTLVPRHWKGWVKGKCYVQLMNVWNVSSPLAQIRWNDLISTLELFSRYMFSPSYFKFSSFLILVQLFTKKQVSFFFFFYPYMLFLNAFLIGTSHPWGLGFFNPGPSSPSPSFIETGQSPTGKVRPGRWSLALKQGVVLKLASSVVVPWGLNWLEWSRSHT